MKKILFLLTGLMLVLASCSDGGSDSPDNPTPQPNPTPEETASITIDSSITSNGVDFDAKGGEKTVSFSANKDWTLSVATPTNGTVWCTPSATNGVKGDATVKFTVKENSDYDDRSVSVTIKAGTASKTFTITQKGTDALLVTSTKFEVPQEGGSIEVEVKANISYELQISETAKSWISEAKSRALTTKKHAFTIAASEEYEKREGEIHIKSGDKLEIVKVYQAGGAILMLSKNDCLVSSEGETISVDIKSNIEYGVQMPNVDWITDAPASRAASSHTLKYVVLPNETPDARSAEIIFYDKNSSLKDTLKVVQAQKDAIIISKKEYEVKAEGETLEVKLSANVDFEVTMPEVDWVSQVTARALTEHTLYFKVSENKNNDGRNAEIVITNKDSQLSEKIMIIQNGAIGYNNGILTVKTAGTLEGLLGTDYLNITSLKVVGPINGTDIYCLRKMLGGSNFDEADKGVLKKLDLTEAMIVEGGDSYYSHGQYDVEHYYTSNNEIGKYMFYGCTNLKDFGMPSSVTYIGESAFEECRLQNVYIVDLSAWCKIDFENHTSNPLHNKDIMDSGTELYLNGSLLDELIIPEDITTVKDYTFRGCRSLKKVIVHDGVISIGNEAFYYCRSITDVSIGDGVVSIGNSAFWWCLKLTNLIIGKKVVSIDDYAFDSCKSLKSISFPDGLISIGKKAFESCEALTGIVIPNSVTSIDERAFQYCHSINSITIGNGVTKINDCVFYYCNSLKVVTIGENVASIGSHAFYFAKVSEFCSYAKTPPTLLLGFDLGTIESCKLFVPAGCASAYKSSQWGSCFSRIIELE